MCFEKLPYTLNRKETNFYGNKTFGVKIIMLNTGSAFYTDIICNREREMLKI